MRLQDWLNERDMSHREFAKLLGFKSHQHTSQVIKGTHKPSLGLLRKIYTATNGSVGMDDF